MSLPEAIVADVDQVLLDYYSRLREYVNKRDGKEITGHSKSWSMVEWLQMNDEQEVVDTIVEFSQQYEFGTLDALPGADVVLHKLIRRGYRLIVLTACGSAHVTESLRRVNLFHRFGDIFDEMHFVEHHDSKADTLKDISSRFFIKAFIDDKPENIIDALKSGVVSQTILMKSPHNREFRKEQDNLLIDHAFSWYDCDNLI